MCTGIAIKSTMDNSTTVQYASHIQRLCQQARSAVRDIDPQNDLSFLRIRTKKHEVMVAPGTVTRVPSSVIFSYSNHYTRYKLRTRKLIHPYKFQLLFYVPLYF